MLTLRVLILWASLVLAATSLWAHDGGERIILGPSANASLTGNVVVGTLRGDLGANYILAATARQRIWFDLQSANPNAYFNIRRSGAVQPIYIGSVRGNSVIITFPSRGDWIVEVYLTRNAALAGQVADYRLTISTQDQTAAQPAPFYATSIFARMPETCRAAVAYQTGLPARTLKPYAARPTGQGNVGQGSTGREHTGHEHTGQEHTGHEHTGHRHPWHGCTWQVYHAHGCSRQGSARQGSPGQGYQVTVQSTDTLRQVVCRFDLMGNLLGFE
ncbi:MAG: hypothetical protein WCS20_09465 [Alphaproteobacteria bacterium]